MANLDTREFVAGYLIEADEHIRAANTLLLQLEASLPRGEVPHGAVRELFRSLHTLKGLSAMVGVEPIVEIAHEMETVLRAADQKTARLTRAGIEHLIAGIGAIEQRLRAFEKQAPVPAAPRKLLEALRELQFASAGEQRPAPSGLVLPPEQLAKLSGSEVSQLTEGIARGERALRLVFAPSPERAAAGISITSVREGLGAISDIVKVLPQNVAKSASAPSGLEFVLLLLTRRTDAELAATAKVEASALSPIELRAAPAEPVSLEEDARFADDDGAMAVHGSTIRVAVARLDDALERLTGLIVTRFRLSRQVAMLREQGVDVRELSAILHEHGQQIRHLRAAITRARMVPMTHVLERVPLLVRGLSKSTGKQVALHLDTGEAELDKAVAEQIFPAIVHLVRNAVDHAIEPPEQRRRLGKSEVGNIRVRCFALSDTHLEVSVADDGAGIDAQKVANKARRSLPRDDKELLALITRPGLSTQDVATEHSGRGMGMDIVKRIAVEQLSGELSLETTPGAGTKFTLRIPLSVSILDSFAFRCGNQRFVVPLAMIDEIVELEQGNVFSAPAPQQGCGQTRILVRHGQPIPLFDLSGLFSLERTNTSGNALVVRIEGERFAISVDRMLGQQEVVVRPLQDPLVKMPGVAGTTDLGDGLPTLVLDLLRVSQLASAASLRGAQ
jgi:two-component system chemotaxis sensor kinase CheA